jgi:peptidoglycan/LPS O-acetylase OafA/YrhL
MSDRATAEEAAAESLWMVEAWRGFAAWLVVAAHYRETAGLDGAVFRFAFTGVDLFFALSGYVFARHFERRPRHWGAYAVRRAFRIYPAYVVALGLYMAWMALQGEPLRFVAEHLTFTHLQSREMAFYYNPAFWSLPAEVEFYLALPVLVLAGVRGLVWLLGASLVLRTLLGWASDRSLENAAFVWMHHLPGILVEFLLGAAAWHLARRGLSQTARITLAVAGTLGWCALASHFASVGDAGIDAGLLRGQLGWLSALCFAALLAASTPRRAQPAPGAVDGVSTAAPRQWRTALRAAAASALSGFRALALWLGGLSYGVYLLHNLALAVSRAGFGAGADGRVVAVAAGVLTLVAAWALHRGWESPLRQLGRNLAHRLEGSRRPTRAEPGRTKEPS